MTAPKRDSRPTLTLKGDGFTPEFRSLLNKAAKKVGRTQAEFAAEALASAARRVLTGTPEDNPNDNPAPPPAVLAQIEDTQKRLEATDAKLEAVTKAASENHDATTKVIADLADQVRALTETQRRGLLSRIFGGR